MKVAIHYLLPVAAALVFAGGTAAWGFYYNNAGGMVQGDGNLNCVGASIKKGKTFEWFRDPSEDCCVYIYSSSSCSGSAAGWSCSDWTHTASANFEAIKVKNC
jgi:hypothetical protein